MNAPADLDALIHGHLDGALDDAQRAELEARLLDNAAARRRFWALAEVHGLAREAVRMAFSGEAQPVAASAKHDSVWPAWLVWRPAVTALAVVLMLAAISTSLFLARAEASPTAILQHALKAQVAAPDRCYRVDVRLEAGLRETGRWPAAFASRLWTRRDRFWIESRAWERTVAWGRDAEGRVWFALSPEAGMSFDSDEVGERLALHCELRSLQVESLLRNLLADFDLRRESAGSGIDLIYAQPKAGRAHPLYRAALLEVDAVAGVLRRVELDRVHGGEPAAKVAFTLVETSLQPDAAYTLAGHLTPEAAIYDRQHEPEKRLPLLARFFIVLRSADDPR